MDRGCGSFCEVYISSQSVDRYEWPSYKGWIAIADRIETVDRECELFPKVCIASMDCFGKCVSRV